MKNWFNTAEKKPGVFEDIVFQDKNGIQYAGIMDRIGRFITYKGESIKEVVAWQKAPEKYEE